MSTGEIEGEAVKPLRWVGGSRAELRELPVGVRQVVGFALWQAQNGGRHRDAKPLRGFGGAGVLEVVAGDDGNTFRAVYTVKFAGAVYVLHAFQKKSKRGIQTPAREVALVRRRLKMAEEDYEGRRAPETGEGSKNEGEGPGGTRGRRGRGG
jgi:phage-related protein